MNVRGVVPIHLDLPFTERYGVVTAFILGHAQINHLIYPDALGHMWKFSLETT